MPELTHDQRVVVRLLRRYAVCRVTEQQPLPSLAELSSELSVSSFAAVAFASVFQLTEKCLNRTLVAGSSGVQKLSYDELAILQMVETHPAGPFVGTATTPRGLLGALSCAVASARTLFPL
jgi:hypothetical protein